MQSGTNGSINLINFKPGNKFPGDPIDGGLQFFLGVFQFLSDGDMLRAMRFASTTADAIRSGSGDFPRGSAHEVFLPAGEFTFRIKMVVCGKGAGDIHIFGTGDTVTAAGAAHFHFCIDGSNNFL